MAYGVRTWVSDDVYEVLCEAIQKRKCSISYIVNLMIIDYVKRHWPESYARMDVKTARKRGRPKGSVVKRRHERKEQKTESDSEEYVWQMNKNNPALNYNTGLSRRFV